MLVTNAWLEKLSSAKRAFSKLGMMQGSTSSYTTMILEGKEPEPPPPVQRGGSNGFNADERGPVPGPKTLSSVELAHTAGKSILSLLLGQD
jgi:hypothetical protein